MNDFVRYPAHKALFCMDKRIRLVPDSHEEAWIPAVAFPRGSLVLHVISHFPWPESTTLTMKCFYGCCWFDKGLLLAQYWHNGEASIMVFRCSDVLLYDGF